MISVIIPTYNHETFIAEAITSCLNEPIVTEILIGDDGSSDRTLQIVEEFASLFPNKIRNLTDYPAKNMGAHNRINNLCRSAKNDWLAVLNSDDSFVSGRFRNFEQFVRLRKPDLIFGNCLVIDSAGREIGAKYAHFHAQYVFPDSFSPNSINESEVITNALLSQNFLATTSNMIFTKSLFERLGGFQAYRYIHDWDFALRASLIGNVVYNNAMWVKYRIHTNNTISESTHRVELEVKRMMSEVTKSRDFSTKISSLELLRNANKFLDGNSYLDEGNEICILLSHGIEESKAKNYIGKYPSLSVVADVESIPANASYVYAPLTMDDGLSENEFKNLILCAALGSYDFIVCSTVLENHDLVQAGHLRNYALVRPARLTEFLRGQFFQPAKGRMIRLPRSGGADPKIQYLSHAFQKNHVTVSGGEISVQLIDNSVEGIGIEPWIHGKLSPSVILSSTESASKPCVFIFPSVLAVGGAENVLIEILKQLKQEFRFVVICTSRVEVSQGSWLWRTLEHADAVYDLGEVCEDHERLSAISWLKDLYEPVGLFLTNSNVWQITNAYKIRRLFRDAAIIDQQAYDFKFGWIGWFDHPGVAAADRFIAVNEKIRSSMIEEYNIPRAKIDLIYHPISSKRISNNLKSIDKRSSFKRFGLSDKHPVVAFVGRLNAQKRPLAFLELAKIANEAGETMQFVMVGQGELQGDIERFAKEYSLSNVFFFKNIPELEYFYCVVDVLVITSEFEGVPLAMLEAMCAGVPVLSTDVGDISYVLAKYNVGKIVEPDCPPSMIFDQLKSMLNMIEECKRNSEIVSVEVIEDFSGEKISEQYRDSINLALSPYVNRRNY